MSDQQQAATAIAPVPADQGAFLDEVISIKQFLSELNKSAEIAQSQPPSEGEKIYKRIVNGLANRDRIKLLPYQLNLVEMCGLDSPEYHASLMRNMWSPPKPKPSLTAEGKTLLASLEDSADEWVQELVAQRTEMCGFGSPEHLDSLALDMTSPPNPNSEITHSQLSAEEEEAQIMSKKYGLRRLNPEEEKKAEVWVAMKRQPYVESIAGIILDPFGRRTTGGG